MKINGNPDFPYMARWDNPNTRPNSKYGAINKLCLKLKRAQK